MERAITPGAREWRDFLDTLLLWTGAASLGAGAIFFIAANWSSLGRFARFALAEAVLVAAVLAAWRLGIDRLTGKAALLVATLATGGLLALFGQTYQTGADTFELFSTWALLALPWIVVARFAPLWMLWLLIVNLAVGLYFQIFRNFLGIIMTTEDQVWALFILNTVAWAIWESWRPRITWLDEPWAIRVLATASGILITGLAVTNVFEAQPDIPTALVHIGWLAAVYVLYRRRTLDLFMMAGACLSAIVTVTVLMADTLASGGDPEGVLLLIGVAVIAMTAAAARWLRRLSGRPASAASPWYVRAMLGIGGWLAAGFVIAFLVAVFQGLLREPATGIVTGLLLTGGAAATLYTRRSNIFVAQLALAVSFAGQGIAFAGIVQAFDEGVTSAYTVALLEGALAVFFPHPVHRVFSAAAAGVALAIGLTMSGAFALSAALLTAIVAFVWATESRWTQHDAMRPIAFGLTLALIVVQATWFGQLALSDIIADPVQWVPRRAGGLLSVIVLVGVVAHLLRRFGRELGDQSSLAALGAAAAVGAASLDAPGIAAALMLVLLARANGDRVLLALGVFALLGYTSAYYYMMDTTLLVKSVAMVATGAVLLAARIVLGRWFLPEPEAAHAS